MFALIKKDIIFTKKWILLSVVYAVVATWLIMHEGATNILFTFFLVPFFVTSLPFTKIMSIEDNSDTRDFIRRLGQFTRNYTQTTKRGLLTTNKG